MKVIAFGLARRTAPDAGGTIGQITVAGQILGTPHDMSPEQCRSEPLDARTDVYALGMTLY